jgi:DNA-directed RNA polymerase alpha subunit
MLMKIHVEFNSISEMVSFSKFAGNDLVQVPPSKAKLESEERYKKAYEKLKSDFDTTVANLERAYDRIRMLDPKGITVNKDPKGFVKEEYLNLEDSDCPVTLTVRAVNALKSSNVNTLQDLLTQTESDLTWRTPGLSKVGVGQIKEALASKGYKLKKDKK